MSSITERRSSITLYKAKERQNGEGAFSVSENRPAAAMSVEAISKGPRLFLATLAEMLR